MRSHPLSHRRGHGSCDGVSVVIPAFNGESFLAEAIESILRQTHRHFEVIVVDDGSTDSTFAIAGTYAERHDCVHAFSIPHSGVSVAMNHGIARARYEWVAVMHADDVAMPRRLERQLRGARENPEVVVWGSYAHHIGETGKVLSLSVAGPPTVEAFLARRLASKPVLIVHASALIRRDALLAVGGYDPRFDTSEDLDLFDRLSDIGPVVAIPEPLVQRRIHAATNTMRTFGRMHLLTRFVAERRRRKDADGVTLDLDTYLVLEKLAAPHDRLRNWIRDTSRLHYHQAAIYYGCRRFMLASVFFLSAACLDPLYAFPRVWGQLTSRRGQTEPIEEVAPSYVMPEPLARTVELYEAA